jgi:hypothetical protein
MGQVSSITFRDVTDFFSITEHKLANFVYDKNGKRKHYSPPYHRKEHRFRPDTENVLTVNAIDAQVDKYDYVIIFPWAETEALPSTLAGAEFRRGNFVDPAKKDRRRSITWIDCEEMWHNAIVGSKEEKMEAVKELRAFMKERFDVKDSTSNGFQNGNGRAKSRKSNDDIDEETAHLEVYYYAWLALAREAICERLSNKCGFQIKLSEKSSKATRRNQREGRVLCRLRAPISRLEALADEVNYLLQLRDEVDPGSKEFWNVEDENGTAIELEEEKTLYTQQQATEVLRELARLGKVSHSELEVNREKEFESSWSRRIHVLERVADRIPTYNKYPAYAAFTTQPKLRYLFKEHTSVRGRTLFRYKDRLYLTKLLIEKCFDLEVFMRQPYFGVPPVIDSYCALHDANRGDEITIDHLFRTWVTFFRANGREVGVPYVTHSAYEGNQYTYVAFLQRPFSQPLNHIRDYFGEHIALLFAWHGMYTYYMLIPCFLGLAMEGIYVYRGYVDAVDNIDWPLQVFNLLIVLWASVYVQHWSGEQKAIALKWGTESFEENEKNRPQFHGEITTEGESQRMSYVDNELALYFPEETRFYLQLATSVVVFILTVINAALVGVIFYLEYLVETYYTEYEFPYFRYVVAVVLAVEITLTSSVFYRFVTYLNDIENHQTNSKYEDAMVKKVVAFQVFNYYGALLFTAFGKGYIFDNCYDTCMDDMRFLLYAILAVRGAEVVLDLLMTMLYKVFFALFVAAESSYERENEGEETPLLMNKGSQQSQASESALLTEIDKTEFSDRDVFDIYSDIVIQFGYLTFFSVAFPLMGGILMMESLVKLRVNAFKLCSLRRRPHVQLAEDIGKWESLIAAFNILGILSTVAILTFTTEQLSDYDITDQALIFMLHEFGLIVMVLIVTQIVPEVPAWIHKVRERNKFIVNKYVRGLEEYDITLKIDPEKDKEALDDNIDVELLQLSGTLRGMSEDEKKASAELRALRRRKLLEIHKVKGAIASLADTEMFNEHTGVAVDPELDFALGMLQLRLSQILYNEEIRKLVDKKKKKKQLLLQQQSFDRTISATSADGLKGDDLDLGVRLKISVVGYDDAVIGIQYSLPARDNHHGIQSFLFEEDLPPFTGIGTRLATVKFELVLNADMGIEHLLLESKQSNELAASKFAKLELFVENDESSATGIAKFSPRSDLNTPRIGAAGGGGPGGHVAFRSPSVRARKSSLGNEAMNSLTAPSRDSDDGTKSSINAADAADGPGVLDAVTGTFLAIPGVGAAFETEEQRLEREEQEEYDKKLATMEAELERLNNKLRDDYQRKDTELVLMMTTFDLNDPMFNDQVQKKEVTLPMFYLTSDSSAANNNSSLPAIRTRSSFNIFQAEEAENTTRQPGKESKARLNMLVTFQYSKLAMKRSEVTALQKELSEIEYQIAQHKVEAERRIKSKAERDREVARMEKEKDRLQKLQRKADSHA